MHPIMPQTERHFKKISSDILKKSISKICFLKYSLGSIPGAKEMAQWGFVMQVQGPKSDPQNPTVEG